MELLGVSALVTGGASGLGRATAHRLIRRGAHVVIVDLPGSAGDAVSREFDGAASFVPADVTDEAQVAAAVRETIVDGRELRVVINCAGIGAPSRVVGRGGPMPLDQFQKIIQVNLVGTFNVIRLAASQMLDQDPVGEERGVIVNTASVAAFDGQVGQAAYAASKSGIVGMTLPIARELADHLVRVVTIAPGLFETPLLASLPDEAKASLGRQVPHPRRLGRPDEYAALAEHVVENPMINGETIRLDGSIRMAPR